MVILQKISNFDNMTIEIIQNEAWRKTKNRATDTRDNTK